MSVLINLHVLVRVQMVQTAMQHELGVQIHLLQPLFHHQPQRQCLPGQVYLLQEQLQLRPRLELLYLLLRLSLLQLLNLLALLRQPYH